MSRRTTVLVLLLGTALLGIGVAQAWASAPVAGVLGTERVAAQGAQVAPALSGLALVLAAALIVLLLAGPGIARVVGGLTALVSLGGLALVLLADARPALEAAAASATGVPELAGPVEAALLGPVLAGLGLVVAAAAGFAAALGAARWTRVGARFERDGARTTAATRGGTEDPGARANTDDSRAPRELGEAGQHSELSELSELSESREAGEPRDRGGAGAPGGGAGRPTRGAVRPVGSASDRARATRVRALDDWEAIERGDDPSLDDPQPGGRGNDGPTPGRP